MFASLLLYAYPKKHQCKKDIPGAYRVQKNEIQQNKKDD